MDHYNVSHGPSNMGKDDNKDITKWTPEIHILLVKKPLFVKRNGDVVLRMLSNDVMKQSRSYLFLPD